MNKRILIAIDPQRDFAEEDGALYVPGAKEAVENIKKFMFANKDELLGVVFTADNHPSDHCSFKVNGGLWDEHCVQGTAGQEILPELIETCKSAGLNYHVLLKGEHSDKEEYSAFGRSRGMGNLTMLRSETRTVMTHTNRFVVCGFCGDYCVKDSVADLISAVGAENVEIFRKGVADIDDGTVFNDFIAENNLSVIGNEVETVEPAVEQKNDDNTEIVYMVANIKAFRGRVIPLTLHKSGETFEWLCENTDENYSAKIKAEEFILNKHKRKEGFGIGRYHYFANETDAEQYMFNRGWA